MKDTIDLNKTKIMASVTVVTLAIIFLYWENSRWLYSQWVNDKAYSHGFFIPLVSLYLIWHKKDFLLNIRPRPARVVGYLLVVVCLVLLLVGRVGAVVQIEALSFFLVIPSVVILLYGWQYLRALLVPILYLQFMIPWLDPILEQMHRPFQMVSAAIGTAVLRLNYPVYSDELYIYLPHISMVVAKECSGINFLISVIAVGVPLVYLTQRTWGRAVMVILIGCVLTVLANGLRVGIAGYMGEMFGPEMLHGPSHIFQGWSVAWAGWIGLFFINWLFGKVPYKGQAPKYYLYERWKENDLQQGEPRAGSPALRVHFMVLIFILISFFLYLNYVAMPKPQPLRESLKAFPEMLAGWRSVETATEIENRYFIDPDNELYREYRDSNGNSIVLYIGYYTRQDNERRLISYHSRPLHDQAKAIVVKQGNNTFPILYSPAGEGKGGDTIVWYQFPSGLKLAERLQVKWHVLKSGLLKRQNNGAVILLTAHNQFVKSSEGRLEPRQLESFIAAVESVMQSYFPR